MKQAKAMFRLGAFQVQITNSFFYLSLVNTTLLAVTVWYAAGSALAQKYAPWFTIWMFLSLGLVLLLSLMLLDYKFIYPSRQSFLNKQSYKHVNPAVADLHEILADLKAIKEKLGIIDEGKKKLSKRR